VKKQNIGYVKIGVTLFLTAIAILIFYDTFYQGGTLLRLWTKLTTVMAPILYGAFMAYLLSPVVNWFERMIPRLLEKCRKGSGQGEPVKKGLLRAIAILLTWGVVLALLYLLMSVLIPQLGESVKMLIKNIRIYYYRIYKWVDTLLANNQEIGTWANDLLQDYYTDAVTLLTEKVLPWAQTMATNLTGGIWSGIWSIVTFAKNLLIGLIVSIYLLAMKEQSLARCCKLNYAIFKERSADLIMRGTRCANRIFSGFVRGKLLDSLIIGAICFVGCGVMSIPYTPLVSVVVGITNVIPFFGPFLGAIPSALLILLVSPRKCLVFIIFIVILQQFDGYLLGPKILGNSTKISGFWVVVAILVGGGFAGVLGMFLGVPICACLHALAKYLMDNRLRQRHMPTEAGAYVRRDLENSTGDIPKDS